MKYIGEAVDESCYGFPIEEKGIRCREIAFMEYLPELIKLHKYQDQCRYHESDVTEMADAILADNLYKGE